jgi:hypothetical protein
MRDFRQTIRLTPVIAWWFIMVVPANMPQVRSGPWFSGRPAIVVGPSISRSQCDSQAVSIRGRFPAIEIEPCFEADSVKTTVPPDLAPSEPLAP